ncbi:josephin-like protein [Vitis riparia]|uniref:josephin-like protein n=1 Tax=Vitis riparia TaxID=96939 RepID=UPI00155A7BD0|nr:josephin-like protein [Vitis riparia]
MAAAEDTTQIYHERQRLQYCLLHALNNLFQEKDIFTRAKLNAIAEKLSLDDPNKETWTPLSVLFKPHHNMITGNYDINVLTAALEGKGKSVIWHDRRNGASSIDLDGAEDTLMGIMLNISVRRFGGIWNGRHWFTLRKMGGVWYNLDSDLKSPQSFKDVEEVKKFLDCIIDGGGEIFLVMNCKERYMTLSVEDPDTVDFICIWVISETDYCKDDSLTTPLLLKEKMSAIIGKRVSYSPVVSHHTIITYQRRLFGERGEKPKGSASKRGSALDCKRAAEEAKGASGNNRLRLFKTPVLSPMGLLKRLGDKMAAAFRFVFTKKKKKRLSARTASSGKSKKFIAPDDSHRSEAIADCIEFINSSALNRSNSVSANSH